MKNRIAIEIGAHPVHALEWVLYLVQLLGGLWIVLPFFQPEDAPNGNLAAAGSLVALKAYGALLAFVGGTGLTGKFVKKVRLSYSLRRGAAFASFFIFLYFVILRIMLDGASNLGWTPYLICTSVAAVIFLRLKWEEVDD